MDKLYDGVAHCVNQSGTSAYPARLGELAPGVLGGVPVEATFGTPFGYRAMDPGSDEHGRGYLLYSFGPDGEDNGGWMVSPEPSAARAAKPGRDYVYNQPRPAAPDPEASVEEEDGGGE